MAFTGPATLGAAPNPPIHGRRWRLDSPFSIPQKFFYVKRLGAQAQCGCGNPRCLAVWGRIDEKSPYSGMVGLRPLAPARGPPRINMHSRVYLCMHNTRNGAHEYSCSPWIFYSIKIRGSTKSQNSAADSGLSLILSQSRTTVNKI